MGENPIIYIVINGELNMSPGKAAAQAVHAAMLLTTNSKSNFVNPYKRTVIVLEAKNGLQIHNLHTYLSEALVDADYYIDEGVNEVDAYSTTALAAFVGNNEELIEMFASFPLYPYDEYAEDGEYKQSSPLESLQYEVRQLKTVVQESMLPEQKRPKWYKRLFKKNGYVS